MDWYSLFKKSALEPNWWQNFYDHFTKAMPFVMNVPSATTQFNSSGNDGNKVWYSFMVRLQTDTYSCGIQLEFSNSLQYGGGKTVWKDDQGVETWQNSTLHQVFPQGQTELVKLGWHVIKNMHLGPKQSEITGRGFILAQNATPVAVLTQIKNAILNDINGDDNDDGADPEPQVPSPVPSTKLQTV